MAEYPLIDMKEVTLFVHYKQGDDLYGHLKSSNGNPVQALRDWAEGLIEGATQVQAVASLLEGKGFDINADTHHIGIDGLDEDTIKKLQKISIVTVEDLEEDEDDG